MEDRAALIRKASVIAFAGNSVLALLKVAVGLATGSLAVLGDGMDSGTDVAIAIMSLFALKIAEKPGDAEHPYGHSRAETLATAALSFIVFFAGAQLFLGALRGLLAADNPPLPGPLALWVSGLSVAGKSLLAWGQYSIGRRAGSALLIANGKNMSGDVATSASVLIGLGIGRAFGLHWFDRVLALLVSLWIVKNAVGIYLEANTELMEGTTDKGPYVEVFAAVAEVAGAGNPHRTRVRRLGAYLVVDLDIEVEPTLSVAAAHDIAVSVERAIVARLPEVYDVVVHVEPRGNKEDGERYGLRPERE